jgi:hypothetical protein
MIGVVFRLLREALMRAVLSDKVRPFVWMYYVPLWCWGVYGTFFAGPATYVKSAMGDVVYDTWVWLHLIATTVVMVGLHLEARANSGEQTQNRAKLAYMGLCFQASGHAAMFWVLLSYEMSAISQTYWGEGTYSIFVIAPYVAGCLLLAAQSTTKWVLIEGEKRRLPST